MPNENEIVTNGGRDRWVLQGDDVLVYKNGRRFVWWNKDDSPYHAFIYALARTKEVADLNRVLVTVGGRNDALTKSYIDLERENEGLRREKQAWENFHEKGLCHSSMVDSAKQPNESKLRAALLKARLDERLYTDFDKLLADNPPEPVPAPKRCPHNFLNAGNCRDCTPIEPLTDNTGSVKPAPIDPQIVERLRNWFEWYTREEHSKLNPRFMKDMQAILAHLEEKAAPAEPHRYRVTADYLPQEETAQPSPFSAREKAAIRDAAEMILASALYTTVPRWGSSTADAVAKHIMDAIDALRSSHERD